VDEREWSNCTDPTPMLEFLRGKVSERKLRLFACACCRRIWPLFAGSQRSWSAVLVAERFADGLANGQDLKAVRKGARSCEWSATLSDAYYAAVETSSAAAYAVRHLAIESRDPILEGYTMHTAPADRLAAEQASGQCDILRDLIESRDPILEGYTMHTAPADRLAAEQASGQCDILRDLCGPLLFRNVAWERTWLTGQGSTVMRIAQASYEEGTFDRLPILADALEEAGCTNADVLGHLRGPGPHVRGCWLVDLLLAKG
jgi:hypothetical protein